MSAEGPRVADTGSAGRKAPDAFRTISEVAEELDLPQHVLRFWETRFAQIKPMKRGGGRRYYRRDDVDLLRGIRHLLYGEGYTIKGVQRILKEEGLRFVVGVGHGESAPAPRGEESAEFEEEALPPLAVVEEEDDEPALAATALSSGDDDESEPGPPDIIPAASSRGAAPGAPASSATAGAGGLSREELRRLQATLGDLLECKRLLDQTR